MGNQSKKNLRTSEATKKTSTTSPKLTSFVFQQIMGNPRFADWYGEFAHTQTPPENPRKSR